MRPTIPDACIDHSCLAYADSTPNEAEHSAGQLDRRQQRPERGPCPSMASPPFNGAHWVLLFERARFVGAPAELSGALNATRARILAFEPRAGPWDSPRHYESNNPHAPRPRNPPTPTSLVLFLMRETPNVLGQRRAGTLLA